jgi:microcystin-dependent protein
MSNPYVGEIRMFGGNFAPQGWAFCDGQILSIAGNESLFQLIGTTYGGDGQSNFALPNLQSRLPIHTGTGFLMGQAAGVEEVTLTTQQIPNHNHPALANDPGTNSGNTPTPGNAIWAHQASTGIYTDTFSPAASMNPGALSPVGGNQPHSNMMPFLCVSFIISLFGVVPSPT